MYHVCIDMDRNVGYVTSRGWSTFSPVCDCARPQVPLSVPATRRLRFSGWCTDAECTAAERHITSMPFVSTFRRLLKTHFLLPQTILALSLFRGLEVFKSREMRMPPWHQSHISAKLQTDFFAFVRRVRRGGGSHGAADVDEFSL